MRELRIRQPARMLPGRTRFDFYGPDRRLIATATETDARSALSALTALVPRTRVLEVRSADSEPLLTLVKREDGEDWLTDVLDAGGTLVGRIQTGETRRHYTLLDADGKPLGQAVGDLAVKKFSVTGPDGERLAQLRKTWAGLTKELLTSADHYAVLFTGPMTPQVRTLVAMVPVILDMTQHGPY